MRRIGRLLVDSGRRRYPISTLYLKLGRSLVAVTTVTFALDCQRPSLVPTACIPLHVQWSIPSALAALGRSLSVYTGRQGLHSTGRCQGKRIRQHSLVPDTSGRKETTTYRCCCCCKKTRVTDQPTLTTGLRTPTRTRSWSLPCRFSSFQCTPPFGCRIYWVAEYSQQQVFWDILLLTCIFLYGI